MERDKIAAAIIGLSPGTEIEFIVKPKSELNSWKREIDDTIKRRLRLTTGFTVKKTASSIVVGRQ